MQSSFRKNYPISVASNSYWTDGVPVLTWLQSQFQVNRYIFFSLTVIFHFASFKLYFTFAFAFQFQIFFKTKRNGSISHYHVLIWGETHHEIIIMCAISRVIIVMSGEFWNEKNRWYEESQRKWLQVYRSGKRFFLSNSSHMLPVYVSSLLLHLVTFLRFFTFFHYTCYQVNCIYLVVETWNI